LSSTVQWIADHILWLLAGGWIVGAIFFGLAIRSSRRWFRHRRTGGHAHPARLVLALLLAAGGMFGVLFTSAGLKAMGPGLLAQRRMLDAPAPELAFERLDDGGIATLAELRGRVVLLNVWATWCLPCRVEMPELDRLQRDDAGRGLLVLHLSDEDAATIAKFVAEHPTSATHVRLAPLPLPETGRPTTYVIDREGIVREIVLGNRSYEQFEELVGRYL